MSTFTTQMFEYAVDDAGWRNWANGVHNLILEAGWVQTSDTGQLDISIATRPTPYLTAGFRIYRRDDDWQDESPIFVKVNFRAFNNMPERGMLELLFATGSNGNGGLTGANDSEYQFGLGVGSADSSRESYACEFEGGGLIDINFDPVNTQKMYGFAVERLRDSSGEPTAEGWSYYAWGSGGSQIHERVYKNGIWRYEYRNGMPVAPMIGTSAVDGTDVSVFPPIPVFRKIYPSGLCLAAYHRDDIAPGTEFPVMRYGVERTYKALASPNNYWGGGQISNISHAILFD